MEVIITKVLFLFPQIRSEVGLQPCRCGLHPFRNPHNLCANVHLSHTRPHRSGLLRFRSVLFSVHSHHRELWNEISIKLINRLQLLVSVRISVPRLCGLHFPELARLVADTDHSIFPAYHPFNVSHKKFRLSQLIYDSLLLDGSLSLRAI